MTRRQLERRTRALQRRTRRQWKRLDTLQRTAIVAGTVVQLTLLAAAQLDITRRSAEEIRGSKLIWRLVCLVNFIGPILYFAFGRITPQLESTAVEATPIVA